MRFFNTALKELFSEDDKYIARTALSKHLKYEVIEDILYSKTQTQSHKNNIEALNKAFN